MENLLKNVQTFSNQQCRLWFCIRFLMTINSNTVTAMTPFWVRNLSTSKLYIYYNQNKNGREQVKDKRQWLYVYTLSSLNRLDLKFLCIWVTSIWRKWHLHTQFQQLITSRDQHWHAENYNSSSNGTGNEYVIKDIFTLLTKFSAMNIEIIIAKPASLLNGNETFIFGMPLESRSISW